MQFSTPLERATLLRRYKRFLADIRLADGSEAVAHCANPGSMRGVSRPGSTIYVSRSSDAKRKLAWSVEAIQVRGRWVGIHPGRANAAVESAWRRGAIDELRAYTELQAEVADGKGSRIDFRLSAPGRPPLWLEVKYVTLASNRLALFPDSVSVRALRHVEALLERRRRGDDAALLFVCPRGDVDRVGPADGIDGAYGKALRHAAGDGLPVWARRLRVGRRGLFIADPLTVDLGPHHEAPLPPKTG